MSLNFLKSILIIILLCCNSNVIFSDNDDNLRATVENEYKNKRDGILKKPCYEYFQKEKENKITYCSKMQINNYRNLWQDFLRRKDFISDNVFNIQLDSTSCEKPIAWQENNKYNVPIQYCNLKQITSSIPEQIPQDLLDKIMQKKSSPNYTKEKNILLEDFFYEKIKNNIAISTNKCNYNSKLEDSNYKCEIKDINDKVQYNNKNYYGEIYLRKIQDRICINYYDTYNTYFYAKRAGLLVGCHFLQDPATINNSFSENNCVKEARKESLSSFPIANILNKCFLDKATSAINSDFAIEIQKYINAFAIMFSITFIIKIGIDIMQAKINLRGFVINLVKLTIILTISLQNVDSKYDYKNSNIVYIYENLIKIAKGLPMNLTKQTNLCSFEEKDYKDLISKKNNLNIVMTLDTISCKILHLTFLDQLLSGNMGQMSITIVFIALIAIGIISKMPFLILIGMLPYMTLFSVLVDFLTLYISSQFLLILLTMLAPLFLIFWYFNSLSSYFHQWYRLILTNLLTPMLLLVFVIFGLNIVESQLFGTCKFKSEFKEKNISINNKSIITKSKIFEIDYNINSYSSQKDLEDCKSSLAAQINNATATNFNIGKIIFMLLPFLILLWILRGFVMQAGNYISNTIK